MVHDQEKQSIIDKIDNQKKNFKEKYLWQDTQDQKTSYNDVLVKT